MASVNQTWSHCVNQMGKTHSKFLAARHDRGTAWERHTMCESAFRVIALWPSDDTGIPPSLKSESWQVAELPTSSYRQECVADIASSLNM